MRRLRILTWDSHPRYLRLLSRVPHDFVIAGRARSLRRQRLDLVLFQAARQYLDEQYEVLSPVQRRLPQIYLEHEPPREHPGSTAATSPARQTCSSCTSAPSTN